ncbi:hypothetical protein DL730_08180 [Escherichia coli]|nr:hypothetical protein [Escherichia coli]HAM8988445.1 hypothetical protein [Escherichia coli]
MQQIADNRVCQVLTCLPEKFVVDFANGIDVAQEHIRTAGERTFFRRLKEGLSGEGTARQNAINASLAQGVEASLRWLTELTTSLATTNYAITAHITETDNAWLYSLSHQTSDFGESEWIHFTGSGYLLRTDAWSYPVLRLKRLGLSKTFRRLVVTLIRRYGVSLIHLDASAECLPGLPTFDW